MLKERRLIDRCEVIRNGGIQVREVVEIYDDSITPVAHSPAVIEDGEIVTPEVLAVTDVKGTPEYHRYVIDTDDETPDAIQAFLDNSKA